MKQAILMIILICAHPAFAYNNGAHEALTGWAALDASLDSVFQQPDQFYWLRTPVAWDMWNSLQTAVDGVYPIAWLIDGAISEDIGDDSGLLERSRPAFHFHNPLLPWQFSALTFPNG